MGAAKMKILGFGLSPTRFLDPKGSLRLYCANLECLPSVNLTSLHSRTGQQMGQKVNNGRS